jgi:DNA-binding Lrp family transcriptional regulator
MAKASWHQTLAIHPAAELFPEMTPDELKALGADIIKNGLTSPVVLWQGDRRSPLCLIDGRSRLDAIEISTGSPAEIGPPSITAGKDFLAVNKVVVLDAKTDPWAYVISANIRRRHLGTEDKDRLIVQLLKADPTKSNRQVAKLTDTSHPHVAKVREQAEKTGDVETVTTSIDSRGRQQPARKSRVVKFTPETIQQIKKLTERGASREKIAETIGVTVNSLQTACSRLGISPPPRKDTRDDIGPYDLAWLRARVDELEAEKQRLEIENVGLRSEIEELRARLATAQPTDDGLDIPPSLRRTS